MDDPSIGQDKKNTTQNLFPGIYPQYLAQISNELSKKYRFIEEIKRGKTGVTYKLCDANDLLTNYYCLKTISPSISESKERQRVKETLTKEIEILTPLNHKCLPSIYDYNLKSELPYYICNYHAGETFIDFKNKGETLTRDEAIYVITSLIDTLEYLHQKGRTHCDLHQDNILISKNVFAEGILVIDFGSGHRQSDSDDNTPDRGYYGFKSSKAVKSYRQLVKRQQEGVEFEGYDFKAFGKALALMVDCFFSSAPRDQYNAYIEFCNALTTEQINDWEMVRQRFAFVIDTRALHSNTERLFIRRSGLREAITLPVSQKVPVGEAILTIINTKAFQRLRHTKQLSFCDWFFPGGTHTRFEHSIGVFGATYIAIEHLARDHNFKYQFNQNSIDATLLAALLHDIGHYPYSHVLEHYVASRYPEDKVLKESVHHQHNTLWIINNDDELKSIVSREWGENILAEVINILKGDRGVLSNLLDGPIDCDKLDYLRRDSHHCGIRYGEGLDYDAILASYCCLENGDELGITSSGVSAVEGLMVVQDQMLGTVYWHETIRSVIAMFHRFLDGLFKSDKEKFIDFVEKLKRCISEYEAFSIVVLPALQKLKGKEKEELQSLIQLHRQPSFADIYIPVATYTTRDKAPQDMAHLSNICNMILQSPTPSASSVPIRWQTVKALRGCFLEAFKQFGKGNSINQYNVVVDVPWGKASNRMLKVRGNEGALDEEITQISHLPNSIFTQPTAYNAPIRVFVAPDLYSKYERHIKAIRESAESMFYDSDPPVNGD